MLQRSSVIQQIQGCISDYLAHNNSPTIPITTLWEAMKAVIRGKFLGIATADNKDRREKREHLQGQIIELERIHQRTGAPRVWKRLKNARTQLAGLDLDRTEYAALRLRHKFYVGGDRCGRLLANRL